MRALSWLQVMIAAVAASLSPLRHCGCAGGSGAGGGPAARWSENSGGAAAGQWRSWSDSCDPQRKAEDWETNTHAHAWINSTMCTQKHIVTCRTMKGRIIKVLLHCNTHKWWKKYFFTYLCKGSEYYQLNLLKVKVLILQINRPDWYITYYYDKLHN